MNADALAAVRRCPGRATADGRRTPLAPRTAPQPLAAPGVPHLPHPPAELVRAPHPPPRPSPHL